MVAEKVTSGIPSVSMNTAVSMDCPYPAPAIE